MSKARLSKESAPDLNKLCQGETVQFAQNQIYPKVADIGQLHSVPLLFQEGMLTVEKIEDGKLFLKIPNEAMRQILR